MQNAGQDSQLKSGNLGEGGAVYAYKIARLNSEYLSVKFWTLGGVVRRFSVPCSELAALVGQIESAIANGEFYLYLGGARFDVSERLLREIRTHLSSYAVSGDSGAQAVRAGVSMPPKTKAPARAARSAARQFKEESGRDSGIAKQSRKGQSPFNGSGTAAAHTARASANFEAQVARIVGDELRKAVMPLLAEIDAIAALLKETAAEAGAFKPVEMDASDMPISTRCGRTSVVVGRRKIS